MSLSASDLDVEVNNQLSYEGDIHEEADGVEVERQSSNSNAEMDAEETDADFEAIKRKLKEMEDEAEKIRQMQLDVEKTMNISSSSSIGSPINPTLDEKIEGDGRSIYVGNVDYGATAEELEAHFHGCGAINRVTILCDKFTGHPKGFAYVEFADKEAVQLSMALDESLFRGRQIKVTSKRTNRPGISTTDRGFRRGGGYRGGRSRGGRFSGFRGRPRFRRRSSFYSPY